MNPDIYLLYEYMDKLPFTVRIKMQLDEKIDPEKLTEAAREAFARYPYFSVKVGLDQGQNYTLTQNDKPICVLPEKDERLVLGSGAVNGHLFAITYRDDCVWFSFSHSPCGAPGAFFWIKTTLYQYMTKKYGPLTPPEDIKLVGSPVTEEETAYPDADSLPKSEPLTRYTGGHSNIALSRVLKFLLNPFAKNNYYYEVQIPAKDFTEYFRKVDGTPYTVLTAMMFKVSSQMFKEKEGTFINGRIATDYRSDLGVKNTYRDFVRFIYTKYEWSMKNEPVEKLSMRARGAIISQNQPELGCERFRRLEEVRRGIDAQPDLKSKKQLAAKNSTYRSDPRSTYFISYIGKTDWGDMEQHIRNVYTITDGDLMLEVNALQDHFCISFQLINKDRGPLDLFCKLLDEEKIPYKVSGRQTRYMPRIQLPR